LREIDVATDGSAQRTWGGFNRSLSYGATATKGDVVGVALDLEAGTMSFSVNGVSAGIAFSESEHGITPASSDDIKAEAIGADWSRGFYPAVSLGINESAFLNLGQESFRYQPEGYSSVLHVFAKVDSSDGAPVNSLQPVEMELLDANARRWKPVPSGKGGLLGPDRFAQHAIVCGILPSLRLMYRVGVKNRESGRLGSHSFTSARALRPDRWTHVCVCVDERSLNFFVDGSFDSSHDINGELATNPYMVGIGRGPFDWDRATDAVAWVEDMRWFASSKLAPSVILELVQDYRPKHIDILDRVDRCFGAQQVEAVKKYLQTADEQSADRVRSRLIGTLPVCGDRLFQALFSYGTCSRQPLAAS
jgi:hypothetical protein